MVQPLMERTLRVFGGASQKLLMEILINQRDLDLNVMSFLILHKITIASSCSGVGTCRKCLINTQEDEFLSCQKSLRNLFSHDTIITLTINYL